MASDVVLRDDFLRAAFDAVFGAPKFPVDDQSKPPATVTHVRVEMRPAAQTTSEATDYGRVAAARTQAPSRDDVLREAAADVPEGVTRDAWLATVAALAEPGPPNPPDDLDGATEYLEQRVRIARRTLEHYERIRAVLLRGGRLGDGRP